MLHQMYKHLVEQSTSLHKHLRLIQIIQLSAAQMESSKPTLTNERGFRQDFRTYIVVRKLPKNVFYSRNSILLHKTGVIRKKLAICKL